MKIRNIFGRLLMIGSFLLFSTIVHGQFSDSVKNDLRKISDTLFNRHDIDYIIVDAVIDGKFELNTFYHVDIDSNTINFNGTKLPKHLLEIYLEKLSRFEQQDNGRITTTSQSGTALSLQDIYGWGSPNSTGTEIHRMMMEMQKKMAAGKGLTTYSNGKAVKDSLKKLLIKDGYLNDAILKLSFLYNKDGVFINEKLLPTEQAKKYIGVLESYQIYPANTGIPYKADF